MNADPLARWYRWLEYGLFGRALERCRESALDGLPPPTRALLAGEGDGRFLAALLTRFPGTHVDVVEPSRAMIDQARRRLASVPGAGNVVFHPMQIGAFCAPNGAYSLVTTHFLLDCFETAELPAVTAVLAPALAPGGHWAVSEFAEPPRGPAAWAARLLLPVLYHFFGWTTGLTVRRLPDYPAVLAAAGFQVERRRSFAGGLLRAERWVRSV